MVCIASAQQYVMMPDSTNNRIVLFDPNDGSVVNPALFPLAGGTTVHALQVGNEIWVSEQVGDRVSRWALDGTSLGALTGGMDNIRGMGLINGTLYVTNAGTQNGAPGAAIVMWSTTGSPLGFFSTSTGATSPFGVLEYRGDMLVSSSNANDDIHKYSLTGTPLGTFHNTTSLNFAEQMWYAANGDILVAGFSSNNIVRLNPDVGTLISSFPASGARGVFQLLNGNIMWTNGSGAHVYNVSTGTSSLVYAGGGRYLDWLIIGSECRADWNGDGQVDFFDYLDFVQDFDNDNADYNGDGQTDFFDYLDFVADFDAGCD